MIRLQSNIENTIYPLFVLEERLKPGGDIIAANWDYINEVVELTIEDQGHHYVLRIPFYAVAGSLNYPGVTVRVDQPYILDYKGETRNGRGTDEGTSPAGSKFQSSVNLPDAPELHLTGERIMRNIEQLLLPG
ncbi:YugN family protein [Lentibacillus amyloliquefaciens]|uniref:YugN-like family protein n=1 Tax=Lentibacillus amyloliquefaciens TaxID=1472767 RepID=A0A0U4F9R7_9BACI|nr:YugN family protein [Lentibacillus amyloliquefaciens]ALX47229.1 hypothetical protein AOX59_00605 [Lentibacillus amyloliquefaciens]